MEAKSCTKCGKGSTQQLLPLTPEVQNGEWIKFQGKNYHRLCFEQSYTAKTVTIAGDGFVVYNGKTTIVTDLQKNPTSAITSRLSVWYKIMKLTESSLDSELRNFAELIAGKIENENSEFCRCSNCRKLFLRDRLIIGEITREKQESVFPDYFKSLKKSSKVRPVYYFCSVACDASYINKLLSRLQVLFDKHMKKSTALKANNDLTLEQKAQELLALNHETLTLTNLLCKRYLLNVSSEEVQKQISDLFKTYRRESSL